MFRVQVQGTGPAQSWNGPWRACCRNGHSLSRTRAPSDGQARYMCFLEGVQVVFGHLEEKFGIRVAFGGSGGGGGGSSSTSSYSQRSGHSRGTSYQNAMRSAGYLNTQDYAEQERSHWSRASQGSLGRLGNTVAVGATIATGGWAGGARGAIAAGTALGAGHYLGGSDR